MNENRFQQNDLLFWLVIVFAYPSIVIYLLLFPCLLLFPLSSTFRYPRTTRGSGNEARTSDTVSFFFYHCVLFVLWLTVLLTCSLHPRGFYFRKHGTSRNVLGRSHGDDQAVHSCFPGFARSGTPEVVCRPRNLFVRKEHVRLPS